MRFQHFEVKPDERRLFINEQETVLGSRAFDVLLALASRHGQVISKHDLMDIVWPDVVVEENNLQVQISALRKLLGSQTITTLPGRGYCLTSEPQRVQSDSSESRVLFSANTIQGNLPLNVPELYGRSADVKAITTLLSQHRLITLTGTGGVGKTHLAKSIAAAQREICRDGVWRDGVWWFDATTAHDTASFIEGLAQCFRIGVSSPEAALADIIRVLHTQRLVLILDNCEHVLDASRHVVTQLLNQAPDVQIVVTSQAKLQMANEHVYLLGTLPTPTELLTCEQALQYGAIQLFVQRVQQLDRRFSLQATVLPDVTAICQQLEGVALSIELAAARVPMLGVRGVRERLAARLSLLGNGSALMNRQATMRATLDWSHKLLTNEQAQMFRRLGVFVGSFSLEAAKRLFCDEHLDEWTMMELLESLIHQSLIVVTDDESVRYRMLETHRLYALEKLQEADEVFEWHQRLTSAMVILSKQLVKERKTRELWAEMNHVRAAYDWAVAQSDEANRETAITLATVSAMVLAVSGFVHEALTRLLKVEPWVNAKTAKPLAARYWQWLGRCGVHGRLAPQRCIESFIKSEKIFQSLGNWRHVHACRRMRAEALLDNHQLLDAKSALLEAQAMETPDWPVADRMRRIKVQALLAGQMEQDKTALRLAREALALAELARIERYVLAIQLDIANLQLKMSNHDEALALFQIIVSQTSQHHYHRLTTGQAYVGLMTVLLENNQLNQAAQVGLQGLPYWRSSGIFLSNGDLFAWWLACGARQALMAARMLGATNAYFLNRKMVRAAMTQKIHAAALALLGEQLPAEQLAMWLTESTNGLPDEEDLAHSLAQEFGRLAA